jgi:hypothetical protein
LVGILVHGSATQIKNPRDIDILLITSDSLTPKEKRKLRGKLAVVIVNNIAFNKDLEIMIKSLSLFSMFSPLHLGILESYYILHDPDGTVKTILDKALEIKERWNSKKVFIDNTWILIPKGRPFLKEPISYSEKLTS